MKKQCQIKTYLQNKKNLPLEICYEIKELLGSNIHHENFKKYQFDLCKYALITRINSYDSWIFEDIFDKDERIHIFKTFEKCQ